MRTSWEKNSTMLAVKSGHTWNHSHADANSFILYHKGFDIIKDAGNCWYPNPQYRNYFFQSEAHNVVMFNGKGQSREQQYNGSSLRGYLYNLMDAGNIKYAYWPAEQDLCPIISVAISDISYGWTMLSILLMI